jgi:hypothetical protein
VRLRQRVQLPKTWLGELLLSPTCTHRTCECQRGQQVAWLSRSCTSSYVNQWCFG